MNPIKIKNTLHPNPTDPPKFRVQIQSVDGKTITLACPKATRALVALMDMQATIGGAASHFGGPSAFAEIMSAFHGFMYLHSENQNRNWHRIFHFVNDAGHCENGLYALKANYHVAGLTIESLKGFRSIKSPLSGHGEVQLFPKGVSISNGPLGSGLGQAQGLAMAESFSTSPRTTVIALSDGGCMEGEAKEALASIPGLSAKGKLGPFVAMISDNNTKLSGRIDEDCFSMEPSFKSLASLGWRVKTVEQGNHLETVYQSIEKCFKELWQTPSSPQVLRFKTVKGKGVSSMEQSPSGGHGFSLKKPDELPAFIREIYRDEPVPDPIFRWMTDLIHSEKPKNSFKKLKGERVKVQKKVSSALCKMFEKKYPIVSISADLQGSTGVSRFREKYPRASFEVGVAEANMISTAIGFSKQGFIPIVDTFAQFGVTKGTLPLIMSSLSQGPLIAFYSHTGFQSAADGASHQAITYLSMLSSIPQVDLICLSCADEAEALICSAIELFAKTREKGGTPRSTIFFLARETYPCFYNENIEYQYARAQIIRDHSHGFNRSVALIAFGPMVEKALLAQEQLAEERVGSIVINPSILNRPDTRTIKKVLHKTEGRLVTLEDHRLTGGFGSLLSHALSLESISFTMKSLGIGDHFGRSAYCADELYKRYGLEVEDVVKAVKTLL